jgi:single-stranded DNA-binding protein
MSVDFYSLNRVFLVGRVMRKSQLVQINGRDMIHFTVGTRELFIAGPRNSAAPRKPPTRYYHSISAWGRTAFFVDKYVGLTDTVFVDGRLRTYCGKDGIWKTIVQTDQVTIMGRQTNPKGSALPANKYPSWNEGEEEDATSEDPNPEPDENVPPF